MKTLYEYCKNVGLTPDETRLVLLTRLAAGKRIKEAYLLNNSWQWQNPASGELVNHGSKYIVHSVDDAIKWAKQQKHWCYRVKRSSGRMVLSSYARDALMVHAHTSTLVRKKLTGHLIEKWIASLAKIGLQLYVMEEDRMIRGAHYAYGAVGTTGKLKGWWNTSDEFGLWLGRYCTT